MYKKREMERERDEKGKGETEEDVEREKEKGMERKKEKTERVGKLERWKDGKRKREAGDREFSSDERLPGTRRIHKERSRRNTARSLPLPPSLTFTLLHPFQHLPLPRRSRANEHFLASVRRLANARAAEQRNKADCSWPALSSARLLVRQLNDLSDGKIA